MLVQNSGTNLVRSKSKSLDDMLNVFKDVINWEPNLTNRVHLDIEDNDGNSIRYSIIRMADGTYALQSVAYDGSRLSPWIKG